MTQTPPADTIAVRGQPFRVRRTAQRAFTLMELLVVVAIIGVLSAIAVPQFSAYRDRAMNATAKSDARNAASAQEAYYVDNQTYASDCNILPGFASSANVTCAATGTTSAFTIVTTQTVTGYVCTWVSNPGTENLICS